MQRIGRRILPSTTREKLRLLGKRVSSITRQLFGNPMGAVGVIILVAFLAMGAVGEQLAPFEVPVGGYDERFGKHMLPTELAGTETVYVEPGRTVNVTEVFEPRPGWPGTDPSKYGLLRVVVEPRVPTTIYMDGQWRNMYSLDWLKVSAIEHVLSFSDVPGYVTPKPIPFTAGNHAKLSLFEVEFVKCGVLNVTTNPQVSATISVDGMPRAEGSLHAEVSPGKYNVSFGEVKGYIRPANMTVTVTSGETIQIVGNYTVSTDGNEEPAAPVGYLKVTTKPRVPTTVYLNRNWTTIGGIDMLRLRPGNYSISFSDVPGYRTPDAKTIWIRAGEVYEFEAVFEELGLLSVTTSPNLPSTIYVNGEGRNDGSLYVYVPKGEYDVTFGSAPDYHVPVPEAPKLVMRLFPGAISCIASGAVLLVLRLNAGLPRRKLSAMMAGAGLAVSAAALLWIGLGEAGLVGSWDSPWQHPVSLLGVFLGLAALGILQIYLDRALCSALVVAALVPVPLVGGTFTGLNMLAFSSLLLGLYLAAGVLAAISVAMLYASFKRLVLVQVSGGVDATASSRVVAVLRVLGPIIPAGIIFSGILAYLVGHWTTHWMGTSTFGADVLSELLYGARTSIIVGIFSALIASLLGAAVGLYSGYVGGWRDEVIMRANDIVLSIPWLVLMIVVAAMLQKIDLTGIILIIGLTGWSPTARMVRAQVLSIRERQYIERARAIGSTDLGIIRRHVLPNSFPLVFANTILTVAVSILSEATLSFLGMRPVGVVTWGTMLSYAKDANAFGIGLDAWILAPGFCIVLIVLGFSLLGYALDDILNPKLRKR
ncbi:MAG: ABC transporter permease [Thermoplasmata archaeon]